MSEVGGFYDNPWVDFVFDDLNAANSFRDLFRELISHVEKQPGETRRPFIVTINQFRILVDKYSKGEATLRDLRDFDAGILSGTTQWENVYSGVLDEVGQAPQDWNQIEEILRKNGYPENEIEDIRDSVRCLMPVYSVENGQNVLDGYKIACDDNEQFQGSLVLPGILADLGYEGGDWWDVRPSKEDGNSCSTRDENGNFVIGTVVNGKCVVEGDDDDDETGSCQVVTQENADECGFEIDENGNLLDKDRDPDSIDEDSIAPFYTNCGGGIFAHPDAECPDLEGTEGTDGDPCTIDGKEGTIKDGVCVPNLTLQDLKDEFGEAAVKTAQEVYDYVEGKIEEVIEDPLGVIREILLGDILNDNEKCYNAKGSVDPDTERERENGHTDCTTAGNPEVTGDVCWKDCVNIVGVLALPGLPMPPGIGELATVRDLEDFLKGIGKSVEDFLEDPAGTVEGWIGDLIEKIKGVFDVDLEDGSKILDWLRGIFGAAVGAWVWEQIEEEASEVFFNIIPGSTDYGLCPDGETPKTDEDGDDCPLPAVNCADLGKTGGLVYREEECGEFLTNCADLGKQGGLVENPDTECGPCLSTHVEIDGQCVQWEDEGPTEADCAAQNREHIPSPAAGTDSTCGNCEQGFDPNTEDVCVASPNDCESQGKIFNELTGECEDQPDCTPNTPCSTADGKAGKYADDCDCIPNFINEGPSVQDCDALDKFHIPADPANNEPSKCGECKQTGYSAESADAPCTPDIRICDDQTEADPNTGCAEDWCDAARTIPKPEDGNCPIDTIDCTDMLGLSDEEHEQCGHVQCGNNTTTPGVWHPAGTDLNEVCPGGGTIECEDPNSTTYGQEGECGPCKETFQKIGDLCQCPQGTREEQGRCVPVTGNPCVDEDGYAEKNPTECGWKDCGGDVYVPPEKDCPITVNPCVDEQGYAEDHPVECGWTDCGDGTFVPPDEECDTTPVKCDDPKATNYGQDGPCIYGPDGVKCDDINATNYGQDGPCVYGPDDCTDCTCAEYAAANPEECFTGPETPTGGGGGGSGGIGDGMFAPRPSYQRQPFVGVQYTSPVKAITVLNDFIGQELRNSSKKNSLFS